MTHHSTADLLVLHAVRLAGFADTPVVARRFDLDPTRTAEELYDAEARGWVRHSSFAGLAGWSLTESGRAQNERRLADELADADRGEEIRATYRDFLPLNTALLKACTDWQLRPTTQDRLAENDHSDPDWDAGVLKQLATISQALAPLVNHLKTVLTRFNGYDTRFTAALRRAQAGDNEWINDTHIDSCHRIWFELHEDLIATLGIDRGADGGAT